MLRKILTITTITSKKSDFALNLVTVIFIFQDLSFIDAPYQRDWFVNSDNSVEYDWSKIRGNIGVNIDISLKIDTYERYRDIIFGNAHDHKFDKYAIVESSKYSAKHSKCFFK